MAITHQATQQNYILCVKFNHGYDIVYKTYKPFASRQQSKGSEDVVADATMAEQEEDVLGIRRSYPPLLTWQLKAGPLRHIT